jgi:hypothetical protein
VPQRTLRTAFPFLVAGLAALSSVLPAKEASAYSPYLVVPAPAVAEATAAYRYANMTAAEALAELDKRKVPYKIADPIDGVLAPVRLTGKLHGVYVHSSIPESQRATSIYEVLDARLALALDDFTKILSRHDIEEVVHYSLYRPNVPREDHDLKEARVEPQAAKAAVPAAQVVKAVPAAKAGAPATKVSAPVVNASAPAAKASAPVVKPVGAVKPASALPALPASRALPPIVAKGDRAPAHGAKQKTPAGTKPAPAAPSAKPAKTGAASAPKAPGRPASPRAAIVPQKPAGAVPVRARATLQTEPKTAAIAAPAVPAAPIKPAAPVSRQTWAAPGTRHPAGLAIDVAMLKKRDGQWISVATHFRGRIGDKTCGDGVRTADTPEARELRSIVCESNDQGVFTYVLTPNYNAAHFDHFHMEIRSQVKWFLYH